MTVLSEPAWRERERAHRERTEPWVAGRRERRLRGERHPVDDFLFEYYPYSVGRLQAWHPGAGTALAGDAEAFLANPAYERTAEGVSVGPVPAKAQGRLLLAASILEGTASRAPQRGCFGLHEWAMVDGLRQEDIRHERVPLRLPPDEVTTVVDELGLRCTHIDAYRFFTPASLPKNAHEPTRALQPDLEQPGCIHATMDLYKYAMWASPWVASELVADCFALARRARDLDMQASPYDCSAYGLEPIRIETSEGRRVFADRQGALVVAAEPLRAGLLAALRSALGAHAV